VKRRSTLPKNKNKNKNKEKEKEKEKREDKKKNQKLHLGRKSLLSLTAWLGYSTRPQIECRQ